MLCHKVINAILLAFRGTGLTPVFSLCVATTGAVALATEFRPKPTEAAGTATAQGTALSWGACS
ncbi:hypothetical protein BJX76DRAFT_335204 [Aspergillus varians]